MGGGAAVRAAAKAAGISVFNNAIRGGGSGFASVVPPAENSVRTASRPVSAVLSASASSGGGVGVEPVQLPVLDFADWELAGGAEEQGMLIEHQPESEPLPRVVFGGPPSIEEARSATNDLKDALEKVFLKSPACKEPCRIVGGSSLSLLSEPEKLDSCVPFEPKVPEHAVKAFTLFNQSAGAQSVVASIVSDAKVWDAVMQNSELTEFLQSQKTYSEVSDNASFAESPNEVTKLSSDEASDEAGEDGNKVDVFERVKHAVVKMVNNVTDFLQNIFGPSSMVNQNARVPSMDTTLGASLTGLAVMAIILVVLKRG